jgi:hypothetical protein
MTDAVQEAIDKAKQGAPVPEWLVGQAWDNGPWWRPVEDRAPGVLYEITLKISDACEISVSYQQTDLGTEWSPEWLISWREWPSGDMQIIYTGADPDAARKAVADLIATSRAEYSKARIFVTYDEVNPDEGPEGEPNERGYTAPGGWDYPIPFGCAGEAFKRWRAENVIPCWEYDLEDTDRSKVEQAIAFLRNRGYSEPSSSAFHLGISYGWADVRHEIGTGIVRSESAHLEGFTTEEEWEIFQAITRRK